jgi:hypothetical protein
MPAISSRKRVCCPMPGNGNGISGGEREGSQLAVKRLVENRWDHGTELGGRLCLEGSHAFQSRLQCTEFSDNQSLLRHWRQRKKEIRCILNSNVWCGQAAAMLNHLIKKNRTIQIVKEEFW